MEKSFNTKGIGLIIFLTISFPGIVFCQQPEPVKFIQANDQRRIDVQIGTTNFTSFLYGDSLEKPVLFPISDAASVVITRGFPLAPRALDPTDHPHHIGLWMNYENVNGIDFWNNSYAIPAEKKSGYGRIVVDSIVTMADGKKGILQYHAKWINFQRDLLLEETTTYTFSGEAGERTIDRLTELTADTVIIFKDAKDGFMGLRVRRELQVPAQHDELFIDDKGNRTIVKPDKNATGNYLTSQGKTGDPAWSTRAVWCKLYGKVETDSVSITIMDHPSNPNYPAFWHARGYGLFAVNPLGENIFTNGQSAFNLTLPTGGHVQFRYRILIHNGPLTPTSDVLNKAAAAFAKE